MHVSRSALFILVGIFCASGAWYAFQKTGGYPEVATFSRHTASFETISEELESIAKKKGAVYAYEVLKRVPLPPGTDLHLLGHVVGNVLYQQKGPAGMTFCTQDFRNACSHSIVVSAFQEKGDAALPEIREACKKAPGGSGAYLMCYHGLGHGILAYADYDLPKTIALCKKTGTAAFHDGEYHQCVGGAIMELMGTGGHAAKKLDEARKRYLTKPLAPCFESFMPREVRSSCLIYLTPQIWSDVGMDRGNPDMALLPQAFRVCKTIPVSETHLRDACFGGFGKEFPGIVNNRDSRNINQLPEEAMVTMSQWCSVAGVRDGERYCIQAILKFLFWGGENDPALSFRFCRVIPDQEQKNDCYSQLAIEIQQYIKGPQQSGLCAQLPSRYRCYER
ncbi:hypothetical protein EBR66_06660 [bacterium]|nr:hypothetical protein [bacterium]